MAGQLELLNLWLDECKMREYTALISPLEARRREVLELRGGLLTGENVTISAIARKMGLDVHNVNNMMTKNMNMLRRRSDTMVLILERLSDESRPQ